MANEDRELRNISSRLVTLATTLNKIAIAFWVLFIGGLATLVVAFFDRDYWWLGAIVGFLLGYGFGIYFASVLNLVVEWMAQLSHAQDAILDRLKNTH